MQKLGGEMQIEKLTVVAQQADGELHRMNVK